MQFFKINKKKIMSVGVRVVLLVYIFALAVVGSADYIIPDKITVTETEAKDASSYIVGIDENTSYVEAKLFGTLPLKTVKVEVISEKALVPCGKVFGVKFFTKGVMVIKLSDIETENGNESPARNAGIEVGDIIQSIDGKEVNTVEEMAKIVEMSNGEQMHICYCRDGKEENTVMKPSLSLSDKKYKTGIWVRDSTAGIGTMTYYDPSSGKFAGLGHGICDVDTGKLMPLLSASVVDVEITDIVKGKRGRPGELKGNFDTAKRGSLVENTLHGVYGIMDDDMSKLKEKSLEVGLKDEVKIGKASILCELDENGVCEYEIEITKMKSDDGDGKNFVIEVTDENLLKKTGGIVQGMSGSPIIQNNKLVGAVTHVLVNSPTRGYGIFIENMLFENLEK